MFPGYTPTSFSLTTYQHTVPTDTHLRRLEEITRAVYADFQTESHRVQQQNQPT
jgi:hypothetical protein